MKKHLGLHPYQTLSSLLVLTSVVLGTIFFQAPSPKKIKPLPQVSSLPHLIIASSPDTFTVNWDTLSITFPIKLLRNVPLLPRTIDPVLKDHLRELSNIERKLLTPPPPPPPPPPPLPAISCGFRFYEQMPLFPGCDERLPYAERKNCADLRLIQFIHKNIKFPATAREKGLSSQVVVRFVVEKDGTIGETEAIKGPKELGTAAIAAILEMNRQHIKWEPGRQGGRHVRVSYYLPVRFCLR